MSLHSSIHTLRHLLITMLTCSTLTSCDSVDDKRIPSMPVQIVFTDVGMWNMYGVGGAMQSRRFFRTKTESQPTGFFYTATTYTGYGGVLLVGDIMGDPKAYDLACPYECSPEIRVSVDSKTHLAVCPKCHSEYDVFENQGIAVSGPAAKRGYSLRRYGVYSGSTNYRVITN